MPLARQFGAALVVGCIDEDKAQAQAITRERKLQIAQRSHELLTTKYGVPAEDIYLHPVARAGWVGLLATSLNLLPIGQLDGGHIVYACFGERHRAISTAAVFAMALLGFVYWPWWVWSAILFFIGRKHFHVYDVAPLGQARRRAFQLVLLIFLLSFIPAPVLYNNGQGWLP